jgi:hypothetical protein
MGRQHAPSGWLEPLMRTRSMQSATDGDKSHSLTDRPTRFASAAHSVRCGAQVLVR